MPLMHTENFNLLRSLQITPPPPTGGSDQNQIRSDQQAPGPGPLHPLHPVAIIEQPYTLNGDFFHGLNIATSTDCS